jgi:hypothetical protein
VAAALATQGTGNTRGEPQTAMSRPYFHHSIHQLEAEFEQQKANLTIVRGLRAELDHRTKQRAIRLRAKIDAHLKVSGSAGTTRPGPPPVSPVPPKPAATVPPPPPKFETGPRASTRPSNPSEPPPPTTNRPDQLLDAWTALEVLSPATFRRPEDLAGGDRRNVISVGRDSLPWLQGRKSRPERRMYYQIVLGSVRMEPAITRLLERYGDSRPDRPSARGMAALAVVILDSKGVPVASPTVAVSSFGWGVMTALNGRLGDLARWSEVEPRLVDRLETVLRGPTRGGQDARSEPARPVDWSMLVRGYEMLVREFGLPDELIEPPTFAVCEYKYYRNPDPPEFLLLNSFFLGDLALARRLIAAGKVPVSLARYLGLQPPPKKRNVLTDSVAIREAVSPSLTPPARWPGPGRHPLSLLQQAAVNLAAHELQKGGLLGVNGPPGTGKTTLLRDIVAHVVAARAEVMCRFDDPAAAFSDSGERISGGGGSWLNLHRLSPDLRGYELLVASSNNKAVENVSGELPTIDAIAANATGLRYFQPLSDGVHERPTWGLIAAVLGNAKNRFQFRKTFWEDGEVGMSRYLAAASGTPQQIEEQNPTTGAITYRLPRLVAAESPPATREEALAQWRKARGRFREAVERFRGWQRGMVALEQDVSNLHGLATVEEAAARQHAESFKTEAFRRERWMGAQAAVEAAEIALPRASAAMAGHMLTRPGWFARLFGTPVAILWQETADTLRAAVKKCENDLVTARADVAARWVEYEQAVTETRVRKEGWEKATATRSATEGRIETARALGIVIVDEAFFKRPHADKQQASPWFPPEAQAVRDEVFQAALDLHRAFINAAAKPIRNNLAMLMNTMGSRRLRSGTQEALLGDLWSTLFLVVPLVSTTFASVERMLGRLPPESLGWLLVDEAGQALPQAAVGALTSDPPGSCGWRSAPNRTRGQPA